MALPIHVRTVPPLDTKRPSGVVDKVVIITGAARGIGLAMAEVMVERGARAVLVDSDAGVVDQATRLGERALGLVADVTAEAEVAAAVHLVCAKFGRLDAAIANAGIGHEATAHETSLQDWDRVLRVNLTGTFLTCKHSLMAMVERGEGGGLVCVSSISGAVGIAGEAAYCASKAGVVGLVRSIAVDYAARSVRCNAICPGVIDTPMTQALWDEHGYGLRTTLAARHPLGIGRPGDVAHMAAFLLSEEARFITGAVMFVDGGYTAK